MEYLGLRDFDLRELTALIARTNAQFSVNKSPGSTPR